ncbi:hypothetical protein [Paraburkholderia caribensis]|uniref:hypothetical protein n=1 Tax=Paraburkholderia caribensis TaxID=75105 RepID=UPI001CB075AD|nr:hypothetical protein [Paraburkholderia caribensis]CAG9269766.1 conserved hypothetical protein [Paraburkholderia caribensis]
MIDDTTVARTRLTFSWHPARHKECYQAIHAAVRLGYNTRDAIVAALPQFSVNRLMLALESLIAAEAATVRDCQVTLAQDMQLLETIVQSPLFLPLKRTECTVPVVVDILRRLGVTNPAGAMGLLRFDAQSTGGRDGA